MAKAAILEKPGGGLKIEDVELADPAPHEVLIDTKACGLCHSDLHFIDGPILICYQQYLDTRQQVSSGQLEPK